MKKLALIVVGFLLSHGYTVSTASAEDANIEMFKQEVVSALVDVFDGKVSASDEWIVSLQERAKSLPSGERWSDEIRAALSAVSSK